MKISRLLDIAGSLAALIFLSPSLICLALLLKLTGAGPVFCVHKRIRRDGRPARLLKFCRRRNGLGQLLARLSMDEPPGLISVLLGEVSLREPGGKLLQVLVHLSYIIRNITV